MSPRFTVLLPVIRAPALLPFAIDTVLAQTITDFELFVICDGAPRETVDSANGFARRDRRVRVFDHPKGERNGEAYRHAALSRSEALYVAHICDDDLWLPNHLAEMETLLARVDFGNLLHVYVRRDGTMDVLPGDLARRDTRRRMLTEPYNIFGTTFGGYRLDAYRRLAEGWTPAPRHVWPDLHMWRKFLVRDDFRFATRAAVTALHFAKWERRDLTLEQRADEIGRYAEQARDPQRVDDIVQAAWLSLAGRGPDGDWRDRDPAPALTPALDGNPQVGRNSSDDRGPAFLDRGSMTPRRSDRKAPLTILFAQELGAGYGHLTNLLAVAQHFPEARRVFVSPHPELARPVIAAKLGAGVPCVTAPTLGSPRPDGTPSERTMAEILDRLGYGNENALSRAATEWDALLERHKPDLVVADFAPTLRIAAAGRVPQVVISHGFTVPPDTMPEPPFRTSAPSPDGPTASEVQVLLAANTARRRLGLPDLPRFTSLLQGDETFATTFPEIDPFAERRTAPSIQPVNLPHFRIGPALNERTGPHIFCYLDALDATVNPVLTALNGLARPSRIFIRNVDPHALAPHCAPQVEICTSLADFAALIPETRLVVHYGSQGTAGAALLAGTPQVLIPNSLESEITCERLRALGVGDILWVARDTDPARIRLAVERMLTSSEVHARAQSVARGMQARRVIGSERPVVATCRVMLARAAR